MRNCILLLLAGLILPLSLSGQSLPILYTPLDARSTALGGASIALDADPWALEGNFAAAAVSPKTFAVGLSYDHWAPKPAPDTRFSFGSWLHTGGNLAFGLAVKGSFMQAIDVVSEAGQVKGRFDPGDFSMALGGAWQFADDFALSLTARLLSSALSDEVKGTAFCADLGAFYSGGHVRAGASLSNLGARIHYGDTDAALPLLIQGGVSYVSEYVDATAEMDYLKEAGVMACLGVEIRPVSGFFLRGGYHIGQAGKGMPSFGSCGLGAAFYGLALEVSALFGSETLGGTICAAVSYSF